MKIFRLFLVQSAFAVLICGCAGDKEESIISNADFPFTVCRDNFLSVAKGDKYEGDLTRGWEGNVADDAQFLPLDYPLDKIYLIANKNFGTSWNEYSVLEFPVYELDGKKVFDICFRAEGSIVWAKNGLDSIKVTNALSYQPFFSSVPELEVSLDLCNDTTPNGKQTYEPYGDKLFKSNTYSFIAIGDEIYTSDFKPITDLSLEMERLTNVFVPRFIISDSLEVDKTEYILDINKFENVLGPADKWEVRCFFSVKQDVEEQYQDGLFLDYNLITGLDMEGTHRGIVSLSQNYQPLSQNLRHSSISIGGNYSVYEGVGYHSVSKPFIFPLTTPQYFDLCYSFRYVGDDENIKSQFKETSTYRFHILEELKAGDLRLTTVIVDVDDFIDGLRNTPQATRSNGRVRCVKDPDFREVSYIDYKLFID